MNSHRVGGQQRRGCVANAFAAPAVVNQLTYVPHYRFVSKSGLGSISRKITSINFITETENYQKFDMFISFYILSNSGNDHPARDCPHPRDNRRISHNRNTSSAQRESGNSAELHASQNSGNGKEEEMLPGKISQKLRQALGIGAQDLPEWIYRMRVLGPAAGYPPAYRKRCILNS
jgi:hypothetical protein